ncbi:hypothetical protein VE01_00583 [Pseudogymnoascus verrucosus]|uniref:Uncharacterized protein n=1 Tax=Pseudogymnoascus verrucosus TaxID=342668 RepID=A0A2P2SYD8_9PEZI|nr:uncharacterized protein VE01_00583 [Pseudogymnoascus verrucosus]OBU01864.1 hypothetical protein VE01_00583 [Pseudogymnoascus verrucosus]
MSKLWGGNRKGGEQTPVSTVRGKISAPIPIPTDDDELPERIPVVGLAIPFGYDTADITADDGQGTIHSQTQTSIQRSPPRRISPQRLSGDELRRSTTGSRFRESGLLSPLASPAKPERRKGSFRAALGRLFGKKPKGNGEPLSNGHAEGRANHKHHKSDPTALSNAADKPTSPQRSNSLPLNQINRGLASHPTLLNNDPLGQDDQPENSPTRPRRATIPSRLFSNAPAMYTGFSGLSPRPTSHGREGATSRIGQAMTSGAHPNRRSRSAGQLKTLSGFTSPLPKRRSEEIRQWRSSFDASGPLSPWSSQRPDTAVTAQSQPDPSQQDEEAMPGLAIDGSEANEASYPDPEPFNFGPIGPMAMAGMTITQAASLEDRVLYLEARLREMEQAISSWSPGPHANGHTTAADPQHLQPPIPPKHASRPFSAEFGSGSETLAGRGPHSRDGTPRPVTPTRQPRSRSTTDTTEPSHGPGDPSPRRREQMEDCSPTSKYSTPESSGAQIATPTGTMRGFPPFSGMPLSKHGSLTAHHYSALLNLIQVERKAREELEEKVGLVERRLGAAMAGVGRGEEKRRRSEGLRGMKEEMERREMEVREAMEEDMDSDVDMGNGTPRTMSLSQLTLGKGGALQDVVF